MSYDLHITKASEWAESVKSPITEEQWQSIVHADHDLQMDPTASAKNPRTGEIIQVTNPLMASWVDSATGTKHYFYYFKGEVSVKNPSENAIKKMKEVAVKLGARVQGDEGELY